MPFIHCSATNKSGKQCGCFVRKGRTLCINHDPAYAEQQRANSLKGARSSAHVRARGTHLDFDEFNISTVAELQSFIDTVIRLELTGRIPQRRTALLLRAAAIASTSFRTRAVHNEGRYRYSRDMMNIFIDGLLKEGDQRDAARQAALNPPAVPTPTPPHPPASPATQPTKSRVQPTIFDFPVQPAAHEKGAPVRSAS